MKGPMFKIKFQFRWPVVLLLLFSANFAAVRNAFADGLKPRVSAGISELFDDNIAREAANEQTDNITQLWFRLGLDADLKRGKATVDGLVRQEFFADNGDFDNTEQELNAEVLYDFSEKDSLRVTNRFVHADEPLDLDDAFGRQGGRYTYIRNRLFTAYKKHFGSKLNVESHYENSIYEVSRNDFSDSAQHRLGAEVEYGIASKTMLLAIYDFLRRDYSPGGNAIIHTFAAGVKRYLTQKLYLDARVGTQVVRDFSDNSDAHMLMQASLNNELDEQTRAIFAFSQETSLTGYTPSIFESWRVSAGAHRQLISRLSGEFWVFYGSGEYEKTPISDDFVGAQVGVEYEFTDHVIGRVGFETTRVESSIGSREYRQNALSISVRGEF